MSPKLIGKSITDLVEILDIITIKKVNSIIFTVI